MTLEEYIVKYGEKEGLRRWKKNEWNKRWRQEHQEYQKQWDQEHQGYQKQWRREHQEYQTQWCHNHQEQRRQNQRKWYQEHREEILELKKRYRQEHYKKIAEYRLTPLGRASALISSYRQKDHIQNRGECSLTAQWVISNIFTKRCIYCGESDWHKLGTDRINNNRPHTPENVVCCCVKCNKRRNTKDFLEFAYSMGAKDSDNLIIKY